MDLDILSMISGAFVGPLFLGWAIITFFQNRYEESIAAGIVSIGIMSISIFIYKIQKG
jgi:hypothetical protein